MLASLRHRLFKPNLTSFSFKREVMIPKKNSIATRPEGGLFALLSHANRVIGMHSSNLIPLHGNKNMINILRYIVTKQRHCCLVNVYRRVLSVVVDVRFLARYPGLNVFLTLFSPWLTRKSSSQLLPNSFIKTRRFLLVGFPSAVNMTSYLWYIQCLHLHECMPRHF